MPALPWMFPDDNDFKSYYWQMLDRGGGGNAPTGGSGVSGPFIPTFSGQAPGWAGLPQAGDFGGGGAGVSPYRRRMGVRPMVTGAGGGPGAMVPSGGRSAAPMWGKGPGPGSPNYTPSGPWIPGAPDFGGGNPGAVIAALLQNAVSGGSAGPNFGGAFGLNPPQAIMQGVRQQAVADAGARERAARLGLQSRGDADPSTYGFQALQSQLQGQDQTSRAMSQADLALRQQQQENYWRMLMALLGEYGQNQRTYVGTEAQRGQGGFDWGGLASGLGALGGAFLGGPAGAAAGGSLPRMGQAGFQYPFRG